MYEKIFRVSRIIFNHDQNIKMIKSISKQNKSLQNQFDELY